MPIVTVVLAVAVFGASVGIPPDGDPLAEATGPIAVDARPAASPWLPLGLRLSVSACAAIALLSLSAATLPRATGRGAAWLATLALVAGAAALCVDAATRRAGWLALEAGSSSRVAHDGVTAWNLGLEVAHSSTDLPVDEVLLAELHPSLDPSARAGCLPLQPAGSLTLWPGPGATQVRVDEVDGARVRATVAAAEGTRSRWLGPSSQDAVFTDGVRLRITRASSGCGKQARASVVVRSGKAELARGWLAPGAVLGWGRHTLQLARIDHDGGIAAIVRARSPEWAIGGMVSLGLGLVCSLYLTFAGAPR